VQQIAYPVDMATTPFTLAALATSAVPNLQATSVRMHTANEEGAFSSAVISTEEDEFIIRIPQSEPAEVRQSGEILGQAALTAGARAQLPFLVPETMGMTRAGDSRAVVTSFIPGGKIAVEELSSDALILDSIAASVRAIHELPVSTVQQAGLPVRTAEQCRIETARLVDRAAKTRLLPELVKDRWIAILQDRAHWDFAPTVVHGDLNDDSMLIGDDEVLGILGFDKLAVGDPAADFAWLLAAPEGVFEQVARLYYGGQETSVISNLHVRARLLHELEIAQWLLHGVDTHDDEVVQDAIAMLDNLVSAPETDSTDDSEVQLGEEEVQNLLDETPPVTKMRTDTEAFDGWDEDRIFHADTDFIDPLPTDPSMTPNVPNTPDAPSPSRPAETDASGAADERSQAESSASEADETAEATSDFDALTQAFPTAEQESIQTHKTVNPRESDKTDGDKDQD
jgi:macrolide phosphotransferase